MTAMNRKALRITVGIFIALVFVGTAAGVFVWIEVAGLKQQIISAMEHSLGAQVEVSALHFDLWKSELRASGISLINQRPGAPWKKGEINQATAHYKLTDLFSPEIPLRIEVSSWSMVLEPHAAMPSQTATETSADAASTQASSGNRIKVTQLSGEGGQVEIDLSADKKVMIHDVAFAAHKSTDGTWSTALKAGSMEAGTLLTGPASVQIQGDPEKIAFSDLRVQCAEGSVTGNGQISLSANHAIQAQLKASNVPVAMLVAIQWQMKLSGLVSGILDYEADDHTGTAHGHFDVAKAKCAVLPFLEKVTALVSLPDISGVEFDKATADFNWKDHALHLSNLDIRKNDTARLVGDVQIDSMGQVDGRLKLGLPSTVTAKWPNLQDKIFSVSFEDYNWTEVHMTGTPDHLEEDLTPRLLAVSAEQGGTLLNDTAKKAADLLNGLLK